MAKPPSPPSDLADKFMLRLPDGMRDALKTAAEGNRRSMNAEIIARLQMTLAKPGEPPLGSDESFEVTQRKLFETTVQLDDLVRRLEASTKTRQDG